MASQAWDFFSGKGLKDFQVAAILGHIRAESGFNPLAVCDGGHSFGLFQHHRSRATGLLDFLGGRGNLGNVGGQLQYAWKELMTSEGRALRKLLASSNLRDATAAFGGFERPAGFSFTDPEAMHNWTGRLQFAEQALRDFGNRATGVSGNLTTFGNGLGSAVTSLSQGANSLAGTATEFAGQSKGLVGQLTIGLQNLFSGLEGAGGGGGGWLARLFGGGGLGGGPGGQLGIALSGGIGLYDTGGFTGAGDPARPAGIVHAQEYVFNAPAVRRLGVPFLEALRSGEARGFQEGGFVSSSPLPFSAGGFSRRSGHGVANNGGFPAGLAAGANGSAGGNRPGSVGEITIRIIDAEGREIAAKQAKTANGMRIDVTADDLVSGLILDTGSKTHKVLNGRHGTTTRLDVR